MRLVVAGVSALAAGGLALIYFILPRLTWTPEED